MNLSDFFKRNPDWTKRKMAQLLDTHEAVIFSYCKGRVPKLGTAMEIVRITEGQVTLEDLVKGKADAVKKISKRHSKRAI